MASAAIWASTARLLSRTYPGASQPVDAKLLIVSEMMIADLPIFGQVEVA